MDTYNDEQLELALAQLRQGESVEPPPFEAMWAAAQRTAAKRASRKRCARLAIAAAACLLAVWLFPWGEQEETAEKRAMPPIDFVRLQRLVQQELQPHRWIDPSPTQFLVESSIDPALAPRFSPWPDESPPLLIN